MTSLSLVARGRTGPARGRFLRNQVPGQRGGGGEVAVVGHRDPRRVQKLGRVGDLRIRMEMWAQDCDASPEPSAAKGTPAAVETRLPDSCRYVILTLALTAIICGWLGSR